MEWFDDLQIEEFSVQDFVDEVNEALFDEDEDAEFFNKYLKSNVDY